MNPNSSQGNLEGLKYSDYKNHNLSKMLAFLVPLRSQRSTNNWDLICSLFERTLKSICAQTRSEFIVIVICNEKPNIVFSHPNVRYVFVEFELTHLDLDDKHELLRLRELDKARRMWAGLQEVKGVKEISYVMFVDADDCISRKIVEFVLSQSATSPGWYVESGYEYPDNSDFVYARKSRLWEKTNTSHIIRLDLLTPFSSFKFDEVDSSFLYHQRVNSEMSDRGHSLQAVPFESAIYITENGANFYSQRKNVFQKTQNFSQYFRIFGGYLKRLWIKKHLSESIMEEFGTYKLNS